MAETDGPAIRSEVIHSRGSSVKWCTSIRCRLDAAVDQGEHSVANVTIETNSTEISLLPACGRAFGTIHSERFKCLSSMLAGRAVRSHGG